MRVLQLVLSLDAGGTERLVIDIAKNLQAPFTSLVCCLDSRGSWAEELEGTGIPLTVLGRAPGFRPSLGHRIAQLVDRQGVHVVHCHQYSPFVYACLAKLLRPGIRLVFTEHGRLTDAPLSKKRRLVNPFLGRIPDRSFAVCNDLREFLLAEGFPASRLEIAYNGVELGPPRAAADRERARGKLGIPEDRFVVGTVARLDPVKNLAALIEAFAALRQDVPTATLLIVGDGPERQHLEDLVRDRNLTTAVLFTGQRSDVRELLPALDLYVNSSLTEGVSLTIVEAMAASLPVVATRVGGNPEVVAEGRSGELIPPRDPAALTRVMHALAEDADRRRAWGAEGRRLAEERFSFEGMMELYASAYLGRKH